MSALLVIFRDPEGQIPSPEEIEEAPPIVEFVFGDHTLLLETDRGLWPVELVL